MTIRDDLMRDEFVKEALQGIGTLLTSKITPREHSILEFIKSMRSGKRVRVMDGSRRVDYLARVQDEVQRAWKAGHGPTVTGPEHDAVAGIDTPIGRLKAITFRREWKGGRIAWATEYYLNDEPITVADIRAAGLAQRPTTRNRQKRAV